MIFEQLYLGCLSQASYLIGDPASGTAAVVDPRRDVDVYLEKAAAAGLTIRHVLLTHLHADFVSGHLELARRTGAAIHVGPGARTEYRSRTLSEGTRIELGPDVRLEVLETPGHTPESVSIVVWDRGASSERPRAVLTGDALFIGDVGRPDLLVSTGRTSEELAGMLYDSLREKLMRLPDETLVYPAHGAGSACGKNLSKETFGTLGDQKRSNWALQPMERAQFVRELCSNQPCAPGYFAWDAQYNRRAREGLEEVVARELAPLALDDVLERKARGALVLDVREPDAYAAAHLEGSINVGLSGRYASWVGTVVPQGADLIVVAEAGREREALTRLARIGYDSALGYLAGGAQTLAEHPELLRSHRRMDATELARELGSRTPPLVLDVRAPGEWQAGHIGGCLNLPLDQLAGRLTEIPRERPLVVSCQGGYRSSIAASLLERGGIPVSGDLIGGFSAWTAAGQPIAKPEPIAGGGAQR
jgi:glyoxylase-like metal-dependent hydrolase (beta-lactamase superfamily II)/rhodanese-related sulfurtransferase